MKTHKQEIAFDFLADLIFEEDADGERELTKINNIELRLFDKRSDGSTITEHFIPLTSVNFMPYFQHNFGVWLMEHHGDLIEKIANQEREIETERLIQEMEAEYYG